MSAFAEEMVIALYDYQANDKEELTIRKNEQLTLLDGTGPWYRVRNKMMHVGLVPSNYVKCKGESFVNRLANKFPGTRKGKASAPGSVPAPAGRESSSPGPGSLGINHNLSQEGDGGIRGVAADRTMNETYTAKYAYESRGYDELSLVKGMNVIVVAKEKDGWWQGKNADGQIGWFPSNYVEEARSDSSGGSQFMESVSAPKPALEVARALYPFNSGNTEELPFEKGDMFDIIGRPENDPEWLEARNADGQIGLVPKNYVETVPGAPSVFLPETTSYDDVSGDQPLNGSPQPQHQVNLSGDGQQGMSGKPWYFGPIKRAEAESLLYQKAQNSEFMVRDSESTVGDLSVSMKAPDKIKHFKVSFREGKYCIGQRKFDSVEHLIDHYRRAPIYTAPEVGKIYLTQPMPR